MCCLAGPGYVEDEENKYIKYFCLVSKIVVVVVVLHGHICVVNENCLYKAILKSREDSSMKLLKKIFLLPLKPLIGKDWSSPESDQLHNKHLSAYNLSKPCHDCAR